MEEKYKLLSTIWLPEPEAYVLHKILISQKRREQAKRNKDLHSAISIGELCMEDETRQRRILIIFKGMPRKWQSMILNVISPLSNKIYNCLNR